MSGKEPSQGQSAKGKGISGPPEIEKIIEKIDSTVTV